MERKGRHKIIKIVQGFPTLRASTLTSLITLFSMNHIIQHMSAQDVQGLSQIHIFTMGKEQNIRFATTLTLGGLPWARSKT
jgi:hypothetical protein